MIELSVSLASNGVVKVPGYEQMVRFGYTKNRGVYRLTVTASGEWEGLTIRAFWHVPGGKDPASSLVADGSVDVPASVTAQPGNGCITFEGSDGTKTVTSADLRYRVSANSGTEDGTMPEPGTPAWQQLVDAVHKDATAAEQAKTDAQTAASESATSAKNAGQSAADALVWADAAKKSALAAGSNSQNAAQYAGAAKRFAEQAADSSSAAERSASAAAGSQKAAESSAKKSDASANTAQESATKADASASAAVQGQQRAEAAATRAETAQRQTESASTDALDKISSAKTDALKALDTKQTSATTAVESAKGKALDAVTAAQGTAVKAVSDAQSTATQAVQTAQTDAVSAVEKAGSKVLESIPEDYQTTVKKVEELKTEKAEIDDSTVGPDAWSSKHIVDMLCPPLEETGNPVVCYPVADYPLGVKAKWEPVQEGSGDPSPDNIRPISGRETVSAERCGENLWSLGDIGFNQYKEISVNYPAGDYKFSCEVETESTSSTVQVGRFFDGKWVYSQEQKGKRIEILIHASVGIFAFRFYAGSSPGDHSNATFQNIQLELGRGATTYAPYTGQTNTLILPRTIYGGEVDAVTAGGTELWKLVTLDGTEGWIRQDNATDNYSCSIKPGANSLTNCMCSMFSWKQYAYASKGNEGYFAFESSGERVHFCTTETWETVDAWKSYLAAQYAAGIPVQIAYKLETPTPITATGAQPIPALPGVNTVLTDADNVTVTGRADPIKRITDLEDAVASMTNT
jgi:hypothetical protein